MPKKTHAVELLLLAMAVSLLGCFYVLSMNPANLVIQSRNLSRQAAVRTIVSATYAYAKDHGNELPSSIMYANACGAYGIQEICRTGVACSGLTDLSVLVPDYLSAMPLDPREAGGVGTGYAITRLADGSVLACALRPELGETIETAK